MGVPLPGPYEPLLLLECSESSPNPYPLPTPPSILGSQALLGVRVKSGDTEAGSPSWEPLEAVLGKSGSGRRGHAHTEDTLRDAEHK